MRKVFMIDKVGRYIKCVILLLCLGSCVSKSDILTGESQYQVFAPDGIPFVVADSMWNVDMRGNHRAVIQVSNSNTAVKAVLPWRRPDLRPDTKKIVVVDAQTGKEVQNVLVADLSSESGTVIFEPISGVGLYYIYYLPYKYRKGYGDARYGKPWNDYLPPVYDIDEKWSSNLPDDLPRAQVLRFESRSKFDAFTPMGVIATAEETDSLLEKSQESVILFPEDRAFPIRLTNCLPYRWIDKGPAKMVKGMALRNEYYVWQIGVWAAREELQGVKLLFSDLVNGSEKIAKEEITCFNQEGINWDGKPISFNINVPKGKIQALWCGVQIPENAKVGIYKGTISFVAENVVAKIIPVEITVTKDLLADKGDGDLWRHSRLRWLNSQIGEDNEPVYPYKPMEIIENKIIATEKIFQIAPNGLPTSVEINGKQILSAPFRFIVITGNKSISFDATNAVLKKEADGLVSWSSSSQEDGISFNSRAFMEYDGYVHYDIEVSAEKNVKVQDIRLETDYTPYASEYFMGAGFGGGYRPTTYQWNWQGPWDSYWIGNVLAGMHVEYRGGSYHGPLLNDYKPLPPEVWSNGGKGTIQVSGMGQRGAKVIASTGVDTLSRQPKNFEFALLVTPVKPLNPSKHFSERYYHAEHSGFDKAAKEGANIINIHHARSLNPVINYPFIVRDSLKKFIEHEHEEGRKVKLYYTIRELTNHTKEIHALKSLNHEIFVSGVGYGLPWHCEHLVDDYKAAWYTELPDGFSDAALVLNGFSRWINYYLEGLRWMLENYKIDGIYMDDVSFDRSVMKRIRKIMATYRPGALIDLHSNTGYSIGPANQYTDFFPYVDRLWFGESFRYNQMSPDEWLVTFSGIPFGVMSEMLQDGGNRFLGMVYGTTARHSYGQFSPAPVWDLWKSFGIEESRMFGYWDENCPVRTSDLEVKATAYVKSDKVLISVGNFSNQDKNVYLTFDWDRLKMEPNKAFLQAPFVKDFQQETTFKLNDAIPVKSKKGWLFILTAVH